MSATKYHNAYDHNFRETSPFDPSKNTKHKCAFCGCWATKGAPCYQCHRTSNGEIFPDQHNARRKSSSQARLSTSQGEHPEHVYALDGEAIEEERIAEPRKSKEASGPTTPSKCTPKSKRNSEPRRSSVPDNALQHQFRETSSYDPRAKLRMKCPSCGCWVTKGKTCSLCKRVTT